MKTVEAGQHEEGRAVDAAGEFQAFVIRFFIFHRLQEDEQKTQRDGEEQAENERAALAVFDAMADRKFERLYMKSNVIVIFGRATQ